MNRIIFLLMVLVSCGEEKMPAMDSGPDGSVMDSSVSHINRQARKKYSTDKLYENYIDPSLLLYLDKNHPTWSIPNRNMWYPQLFKKYMTDTSLANYVSGDFNCDGLKDHALLVDKGNNMLAAIVFLTSGSTFKTQSLTEFPYRNSQKIEERLKLYPPGNYVNAEPGLADGERKVTFKCPAVGVGPFSELYEGGKDVYYWENNELRSCLIMD